MLEELHDIEYWKKEYLEISKDNDKLEQKLQQYKQQIDELVKWLNKKIDDEYEKDGIMFGPDGSKIVAYQLVLSKLKERNEE